MEAIETKKTGVRGRVIKLILEEGGDSRVLELEAAELTIGRTADNAVRVSDALSSRKHCKIQKTDEGFVVEDLKSRNGTTLNGKPLVEPRVLAIGDRIAIGLSVVHFGAKLDDSEKKAPTSDRAKAAKAVGQSGAIAKPVPATTSSRATKKTRYAVKFLDGDKKGKSVGVASFPYTIGSKKNVSLTLEVEDVSPEHCMLVEDDGAVHAVDLNSEHGTFVDGKKVKGREKLKPSSILTLGKTTKLKWKDLAAKTDSNDELEAVATTQEAPPKLEPPVTLTKAGDVRAESGKLEGSKAARADEVEDLDSLGNDDEDDAGARTPEEGTKIPARPAKTSAKAPASPATSDKVAKEKSARRPKGAAAADDAASAALLSEEETGIAAGEFTAQAVAGDDGGALGAVAVVLLILVLFGAAIPVVISALAKEDLDPEPTDKSGNRTNLVRNWSFENEPPLQGWAGDAKIVTTDVSYGKRAAGVECAGAKRGDLRAAEPQRLSPGQWIVLNASIRTTGAAAAVLGVEWTDERRADWRATSYSAVADKLSTWSNAGNVALAPPEGATHARVVAQAVGVGEGSGTAVFDRIFLQEEPPPEGAVPAVRAAGLDVTSSPRGVLTLARGGKALGLVQLTLAAPDGKRGDPLSSQEAWTIATPAALQGNGAILAEGSILDLATGDHVNASMEARPVGEGLRLSYEARKEDLAEGRALRVSLVVPKVSDLGPIEVATSSGATIKLDDAFAQAASPFIEIKEVVEIAWGEGADQASLRTRTPVALEAEKVGGSLRLQLVAVPSTKGDFRSLGLELAKASSLARERLRSLFEQAETAKRESRLEDARAAYARIAREFSHEPEAAERARKAAAELAQRADRLLDAVQGASDDAEELALPELARAARSWADELARGFPGGSQLQKANALAARAEEKSKAAKDRVGTTRGRELVALAMKHREAGRMALARTIYRYVIDKFPADDSAAVEAKERLAAMPPEQ